jgi:hypothetical protein
MRVGFELRMGMAKLGMAKPELDFEEEEVPMKVAFHMRQSVFRSLRSVLGEHHTNHRIPPRRLFVAGREVESLSDHAEVVGV